MQGEPRLANARRDPPALGAPPAALGGLSLPTSRWESVRLIRPPGEGASVRAVRLYRDGLMFGP